MTLNCPAYPLKAWYFERVFLSSVPLNGSGWMEGQTLVSSSMVLLVARTMEINAVTTFLVEAHKLVPRATSSLAVECSHTSAGELL